MTPSRAAASAAPAVPPLFAGLCDDAALFPPGNAPVAAAVPAHRVHRSAWYAALVGPFLVGADRIAEVGGTAAADGPLDVVLVVRAGPVALAPALDALAAWPSLRLAGVELGPDAGGTPAEAAARGIAVLERTLPSGTAGVLEIRRGPGLAAALDTVAASPYRAKYRTGGLESAAFPPVAELAAFLTGCAERGLPFKCTAGLHHAVRHTDPATGFTHHGFLNILAATVAATPAGDPTATAAAGPQGDPAQDPISRAVALLESTSGRELAAAVAGVTDRGLFTAYGTCGIDEPLDDLAALGLLARPAGAPPLPSLPSPILDGS
ncbi:hypothetical protein V2S66_23350 [Streptomyces sp. V4-01]|uniref:Uncharacterized protein n=1 Tax=Actinacidiphila polyblastidii TaxID=3110430 RepID=A0ABU7PGD9_9ACTN|nr:hypothetical protein [Streptomyces sp. V4-01]